MKEFKDCNNILCNICKSYTTIALFIIANATNNKIQSKYFLANNPKFIDGGNDDIKHHLFLPSPHFEKIIRY